jgi:glycosidase
MFKNASLLVLVIIAAACSTGPSRTVSEIPIDLNEKKGEVVNNKYIIYQMMTRLFGNTNTTNAFRGTLEENGVGTFEDITVKALEGLKELGVTHVWYTGVIEHMTMVDQTVLGIPLDDSDVIKGRAGSPYAIKDYYDVNPFLAVDPNNRMQEFEALVQRTHNQGLKVLIDFVPNHVARIYSSDAKPAGVEDFGANDDTSVAFAPNNNYFYIPDGQFSVPKGHDPLGEEEIGPLEDGLFDETPPKATGNDNFSAKPRIGDWFETVKLNYGYHPPSGEEIFDPIPDTWLKMRDILSYWVNKGVDGFRCDMAEMVPVEFWNWVIPQIKQNNPEVIFIAEIYNPSAYKKYINEGKFDFLYDKVGLYDKVKAFAKGGGNVLNLQDTWFETFEIDAHMLRFMENHDEMRLANKRFAASPQNAYGAMAVTATLGSGPVMIYFGQEVGEPGNGKEGFGGEDARTTIFDFWGVPNHQLWVNGGAFDGGALPEDLKEVRNFYARLLTLSRDTPAINSGQLYDLTWANFDWSPGFTSKTFAYFRYVEDQQVLVVVNFDLEEDTELNLTIPTAAWDSMGLDPLRLYTLKDLFLSEKEYSFDGIGTTTLEQGVSSLSITLKPREVLILNLEDSGPLPTPEEN